MADTAALPASDPTWAGDVLVAAAVAGVLSGAPSTAHALATGRSPLAAAWAAGVLLGRPSLVRGAVAHAAISIVWTAILAAALPRRTDPVAGAAEGAGAGLAIAALDLGVIGRRVPAIRELPAAPQVADHLAFGALVGLVLARRQARRADSSPVPTV